MRSIFSEARNTIPFFFFLAHFFFSFLLKLAILFRIDYTIMYSRALVCITFTLPPVCSRDMFVREQEGESGERVCVCWVKIRLQIKEEKKIALTRIYTEFNWMSKHKNVMWGNAQDIDIWIQKLDILSSFYLTNFFVLSLFVVSFSLRFASFRSFVSCALYFHFSCIFFSLFSLKMVDIEWTMAKQV